MGFRNLIFQQGEEAIPALDMLEERGPLAAIEYLAYLASEGDPSGQEVREESAAGQADRTFGADGYLLTWDRGGNYIGLEREEPGPGVTPADTEAVNTARDPTWERELATNGRVGDRHGDYLPTADERSQALLSRFDGSQRDDRRSSAERAVDPQAEPEAGR